MICSEYLAISIMPKSILYLLEVFVWAYISFATIRTFKAFMTLKLFETLILLNNYVLKGTVHQPNLISFMCSILSSLKTSKFVPKMDFSWKQKVAALGGQEGATKGQEGCANLELLGVSRPL